MTSLQSYDRDTSHNMASSEPQQEGTKRFTAVNAYLYTPPENNADSFSQDDTTPAQPKRWEGTLPPIQASTPPASPVNTNLPSIASATGFLPSDVPLYPERRTDHAHSQTPLFEADHPHPITRPQSAPSGESRTPALGVPAVPATATLPRRDTFPTILGVENPDDALRYFYSRVDELRSMPRVRSHLPPPQKSRSPERDDFTKQQLRRISKPTGISKSRDKLQIMRAPKAAVAASRVERVSPPKRRTPKARTTSDFLSDAWPATQPTKHKRAPPSKKVEDDNKDWKELPDYAPPTSTLDANAKTLKAAWHGTPVDLSNDVDRSSLHPQELGVAQTLRLTCASYMFNKRKIFSARLQAIKDGKNFTKTAAQGACSIDVNKASQLWEAFEKVGWFKETWFDKYL